MPIDVELRPFPEPSTGPVIGPDPASPPGPRALLHLGLAALTVLLVAEVAARAMEPSLQPVQDWPDSSYTVHHDQLSQVGPLDYLVVGSSSVGAAIHPDDLAEQWPDTGTGYAYWLAGPPLRSLEAVTAGVLLDELEPGMVVLGVTMREFNATSMHDEHHLALLNSPPYREATGQSSWLAPADALLRQHVALARQRAVLRQPADLWHDLRSPNLAPAPVATDGHLLGGERDELADEPPEHLAQERAALADFTVSDADLAALGSLLTELGERDIPTLVVNLPVTEEFIELAPGGQADYEAYVQAVEAEAATNGARWHDLMDGGWNDSHFRDVNHLNGRGVARLLPMLADLL